jgi:Lrp/AsnC family transcriptional regulator of ectoine degradation
MHQLKDVPPDRTAARGGGPHGLLCAPILGRNSTMLDQIDVRILSILQREGRISKSGLAERVSLSPSACFERLKRLEKKKIILSYHGVINIRALFEMQTFFMTLTLRTHRSQDFATFERYIRTVPKIVESYALGGGIDYLLKIIAKNVDQYQELVDMILDAQIGIDRYFTYIVTKVVQNSSQPSMDMLVENVGFRGHDPVVLRRPFPSTLRGGRPGQRSG